MTNILTWRNDWTLCIDTLDDDHRQIVKILLEIAVRFGRAPWRQEGPMRIAGKGRGSDADALCAALDQLGSTTREHFRREEEFMRTIDYPLLGDHRSEHALLLAEHTALVRELRERGAECLTPEELDDLKQWVVAHILGADRGFAEHYFKLCGSEPARC